MAAAAPRTVDVGGGVDLLRPTTTAAGDALYPPSMQGTWVCQRRVVSVQGDSYQALAAWWALNGGNMEHNARTWGTNPSWTTQYLTRFIPPPNDNGAPSFVVLDRGYDMRGRSGGTIGDDNSKLEWTVHDPNRLVYHTGNNNNNNQKSTELQVVARSIEPPTDAGFGSNELVCVRDGLLRAARVQQRWRRGFREDGITRVVQGLELVKTYRVLDGIAGTEFPTSVVRSELELVRPAS